MDRHLVYGHGDVCVLLWIGRLDAVVHATKLLDLDDVHDSADPETMRQWSSSRP